MSLPKVAVAYPYVPHYRAPVFKELANCRNPFVFFAGDNSIDSSIRSHSASPDFEIRPAPVHHWRGMSLQRGLLRAVLGKEFDVLVFLGNVYFLSTWWYAALARLRGKRVYFWTHGWLARETGVKARVRNTFYRLAHGLLLYGPRARQLGIEAGFKADRLHVIYNSLDYPLQRATRERLADLGPQSTQTLPAPLHGDVPFVACVARLTKKCAFDLAIEALALIAADGGGRIPLVLIGDGPDRKRLEGMARAKDVDVTFLGEIYDEALIGSVLYHARVVVSPGKVGLTAMHSLAYGTPVITHGNFAEQMPEYEAIEPARSGGFFEQGDAHSLAREIQTWLGRIRTTVERQHCVAVIESRYTPRRQVELMQRAMFRADVR